MDKKDILLQLIQYYTHGNKAAFARLIGITPNGLSTWIARNTFDANKIVSNCEYVNPTFLLTGEGPVTLNDAPIPSSEINMGKIDQRINELLIISTNLYELYKSVNDRLAEATAIITKSQQQFDRVLKLFENKIGINYLGMVAEDMKNK